MMNRNEFFIRCLRLFSALTLVPGGRLLARSSAAANCMFTLKSGSWSDTRLWSCGRLPTATDVVTVKPGHTVIVDVNGVIKDLVMEGGTIQYNTGIKLTING